MAKRVGDVLVVEPDDAVTACEVCGTVAELRPYGPDGKSICFDCGIKDPVGTYARMKVVLEEQLRGVTSIVGPHGEVVRLGRVVKDSLASRAKSRQ